MQGNGLFLCYNSEDMRKGGWKMAGKRCIISVPLARRRAWIAAALLLLAVLAALLWPRPAQAPAASFPMKQAAQGLNDYDVTLRLNAEEGALAITETLQYRNGTGETLDSLVMRTWLNAFQREDTSPAGGELFDACYPNGFSPGGVTLYDVLWNGERAAHEYINADETALEISIPPLEKGKEGVLTLRCVAQIPFCAHRTGRTDAGFQLGNVIPLLSRYENGAWRTDEYCAVGDPFLSDCANFRLTVHLPEGYMPACSALLVQSEDGAWRGEMQASRDMALCVSRDYKTVSEKRGNVQVISCAWDENGAKRALEDALKALDTFSSLYGEYPYPSFTVCSADFPFGGMEYPGLCMIGSGDYLESRAESLELTVVHETAHQWFYAIVGSDQVNDPWQDEALCEYALLRYVEKRYGQGSFETLKYYRVDAAMQESVPGNLTPGSPIHYFGNLQEYSTVVYGRGAGLLLALNEMLPRGADDFLRAYARTFAFQYVSRSRFEAFLAAYAEMDAGPLLTDYLDTAM